MPTGIVREVRAAQPLNTVLSTIVVSPVGSKMDVREVLLLNMKAFNAITWVADKLIDFRDVQLSNALLSMFDIVLGIVIDVIEEQL